MASKVKRPHYAPTLKVLETAAMKEESALARAARTAPKPGGRKAVMAKLKAGR
jgi:hypothetical protein